MRYRLAALMLLAVLPLMRLINLTAAPAPDPSAILDIGPPPKGETADQYRKRMIEAQIGRITLCDWMSDSEVKKLSAVAGMKDPRPWLAKNLRVTEEDGQRRLRFTFRAGTRTEQVVILNALLRINLHAEDGAIKWGEECLRWYDKHISDLEKCIKRGQEVDTYREAINHIRTIKIPELRDAIDSQKKRLTVIKWAK
jgi:hypothetical protein